jgi:hypothetical protein
LSFFKGLKFECQERVKFVTTTSCVTALSAPGTLKRWRPLGVRQEQARPRPEKPQQRSQDKMRRIHKEDGPLTGARLVQPRLELLVVKGGVGADIGFGREGSHAPTAQPQVPQAGAHLRQRTGDPGFLGNDGLRLFERGAPDAAARAFPDSRGASATDSAVGESVVL